MCIRDRIPSPLRGGRRPRASSSAPVRSHTWTSPSSSRAARGQSANLPMSLSPTAWPLGACLLYTSDAADDM
eukprot:5566805-Alexandrium_andersonii.AAC.1